MAFNNTEANRDQIAALLQALSAKELQLQLQLQKGLITEEKLKQEIAKIDREREKLIAAARQQNQTGTASPKLD